jgi:hypothetical protein
MTEYTIDFSVWATIKAESIDDGYAQGQAIINIMAAELAKHGIEISAVVDDNGLEEVN